MYIIKPYSIRRNTFHCNVMINHKINANQPLVAKDPANTVLEFDLGKASDLYGSVATGNFSLTFNKVFHWAVFQPNH